MEYNEFNYNNAVEYILNIPRFTKKNPLENTAEFLNELNIDKDSEKIKIIHVAGTNGKGSVCAMLDSVLRANKKRVGLFTSPHLEKINERIKINGKDIDDEEFLDAFKKVMKVVKSLEEKNIAHPTFFEFIFLMAMYIFSKNDLEYVILETGMGGRLDATNSITKKYLTIITKLSLDHTEYLGDTLDKIAIEKLGIIRKDTKNIFYDVNDEITKIILDESEKVGALPVKCNIKDFNIDKKSFNGVDFSMVCGYYKGYSFKIPFMAEYQVENALIVLKAVENIPEIKDNIKELKEGLLNVKWPGRMEFITSNVVVDGSHNADGIDEFVKEFKNTFVKGDKYILFSVVKDKDFDYMIKKLASLNTKKIFITKIDSARALDTKEILDKFKLYKDLNKDFNNDKNSLDIEVIDDTKKALDKAISSLNEDDILFCTGSLYLVGEIKKGIHYD